MGVVASEIIKSSHIEREHSTFLTRRSHHRYQTYLFRDARDLPNVISFHYSRMEATNAMDNRIDAFKWNQHR